MCAPWYSYSRMDLLIKKVIRGTSIGEAVERARYERSMLHDGFRRLVAQRVKREELTEADAAEIIEFYESRFDAYTYLAVNGKPSRSKRSRE